MLLSKVIGGEMLKAQIIAELLTVHDRKCFLEIYSDCGLGAAILWLNDKRIDMGQKRHITNYRGA